MLTGDLFPFENENKNRFTMAAIYFTDGSGLALTDRMKNAYIKLFPEDKKGVDALSKDLNFRYLKQHFSSKSKVKNILLDQNIIRGIGNGYSDEILWHCRISPFSIAAAIPDEKIKELVKTIKKVLNDATKKIMKNYPGLTTGEVKDFLEIHHRGKKQSPTGKPILIDKSGSRKTFYTDEQILYK